MGRSICIPHMEEGGGRQVALANDLVALHLDKGMNEVGVVAMSGSAYLHGRGRKVVARPEKPREERKRSRI